MGNRNNGILYHGSGYVLTFGFCTLGKVCLAIELGGLIWCLLDFKHIYIMGSC